MAQDCIIERDAKLKEIAADVTAMIKNMGDGRMFTSPILMGRKKMLQSFPNGIAEGFLFGRTEKSFSCTRTADIFCTLFMSKAIPI